MISEIEDLILGIVASAGRCLFLGEIENRVSFSKHAFETAPNKTVETAVESLVAGGFLTRIPKQERIIPASKGKPGVVKSAQIIRVSSEIFCLPSAFSEK